MSIAAKRREEWKVRLAETEQSIKLLKLRLAEKCEPELQRDLKELKRQRKELYRHLAYSKALMDRKAMPFCVAFLQASKRLLPAPVFKELRLATYDYRGLEEDDEVEQMLLERREYVEEAVRGVRY